MNPNMELGALLNCGDGPDYFEDEPCAALQRAVALVNPRRLPELRGDSNPQEVSQ